MCEKLRQSKEVIASVYGAVSVINDDKISWSIFTIT